MNSHNNEGLKVARLMMVLSSLSPLFVLWAVRGVSAVNDSWLWTVCGLFIVIPNVVLWARIRIAQRRNDTRTLIAGKADDHREHLLVYLFAMLIPLYDANIGTPRDAAAAMIAFLFIVFLFWHLNMHYMNVLFALFGYKVFTIYPPISEDKMGGKQPFVLLTMRSHLENGDQIKAFRLSNTVFFEQKDDQ